jgi:outer membrane protein TolC
MPYCARRLPAALLCLSACLSLGLAGCVPATQALKADPGPVPVVLESSAKGLADAHQVHWRSFFKDPQLQQLIESALDHNRDLRVAAARAEEARAQWALVKADTASAFTVKHGTVAGNIVGITAPMALRYHATGPEAGTAADARADRHPAHGLAGQAPVGTLLRRNQTRSVPRQGAQ